MRPISDLLKFPTVTAILNELTKHFPADGFENDLQPTTVPDKDLSLVERTVRKLAPHLQDKDSYDKVKTGVEFRAFLELPLDIVKVMTNKLSYDQLVAFEDTLEDASGAYNLRSAVWIARMEKDFGSLLFNRVYETKKFSECAEKGQYRYCYQLLFFTLCKNVKDILDYLNKNIENYRQQTTKYRPFTVKAQFDNATRGAVAKLQKWHKLSRDKKINEIDNITKCYEDVIKALANLEKVVTVDSVSAYIFPVLSFIRHDQFEIVKNIVEILGVNNFGKIKGIFDLAMTGQKTEIIGFIISQPYSKEEIEVLLTPDLSLMCHAMASFDFFNILFAKIRTTVGISAVALNQAFLTALCDKNYAIFRGAAIGGNDVKMLNHIAAFLTENQLARAALNADAKNDDPRDFSVKQYLKTPSCQSANFKVQQGKILFTMLLAAIDELKNITVDDVLFRKSNMSDVEDYKLAQKAEYIDVALHLLYATTSAGAGMQQDTAKNFARFMLAALVYKLGIKWEDINSCSILSYDDGLPHAQQDYFKSPESIGITQADLENFVDQPIAAAQNILRLLPASGAEFQNMYNRHINSESRQNNAGSSSHASASNSTQNDNSNNDGRYSNRR